MKKLCKVLDIAEASSIISKQPSNQATKQPSNQATKQATKQASKRAVSYENNQENAPCKKQETWNFGICFAGSAGNCIPFARLQYVQ